MKKLPKVIPKPAELGHEALLIIGGTLLAALPELEDVFLAALIIGCMPGVRDWIKKQWGGAPTP